MSILVMLLGVTLSFVKSFTVIGQIQAFSKIKPDVGLICMLILVFIRVDRAGDCCLAWLPWKWRFQWLNLINDITYPPGFVHWAVVFGVDVCFYLFDSCTSLLLRWREVLRAVLSLIGLILHCDDVKLCSRSVLIVTREDGIVYRQMLVSNLY